VYTSSYPVLPWTKKEAGRPPGEESRAADFFKGENELVDETCG